MPEIKVGRGTEAAVGAPDFKGIAIAHRADNRIVAPGVAGPRPGGQSIQFERDCHAYPGGIAPRQATHRSSYSDSSAD